MKRALIGLVCLGGLAACEPTITSRQPLITAGPESVRPGLWARLEEGCATPTSAAVHTWPVCATPFWVSAGELTFLIPSPIRTSYVLSSGRPMLVQQLQPKESDLPASMRTPGGADLSNEAPSYGYMAVQPEGESPFARGRVWDLRCPGDETAPIAGIVANIEGGGCEAESAGGLQALAARATSTEKGRAIVWVALA